MALRVANASVESVFGRRLIRQIRKGIWGFLNSRIRINIKHQERVPAENKRKVKKKRGRCGETVKIRLKLSVERYAKIPGVMGI